MGGLKVTVEAYLLNLLREYKDDNTIKKWVDYVCDFFSCFDRDKDVYLHLPSGDGYYKQDEFYFTIWQNIRYIYYDLMSDQVFLEKLEHRREFLQKMHKRD